MVINNVGVTIRERRSNAQDLWIGLELAREGRTFPNDPVMFPDRHPYAGGAQHYAAYLENDDGFEVELVAANPVQFGRGAG
ncbi:hypothetical protein [Streptomyces sp. NBC_00162]|uniref:hypothetical protein n=1 Tax=Streptomyces sp. NBC_00162 TaxID=2903629 RepID=UPI00214BCC7F|nr:hypothetical protein [Streptomyces sp. NBC_00162]UUU44923.1 hypothetical protein JIW86_00260 [Streptomyces sp. NBC_00162]